MKNLGGLIILNIDAFFSNYYAFVGGIKTNFLYFHIDVLGFSQFIAFLLKFEWKYKHLDAELQLRFINNIHFDFKSSGNIVVPTLLSFF